MPEISIVIPTYNASFSIGQCLEAIYKTKNVDFEVIVVDDISTDNTLDVVRKYPCRVIELEKKSGPSVGRNAGVENAQSDIVMFVDSDAVVQDGGIEWIVEGFKGNPSVACISGVFDANPNEIGWFSRYRDRQVVYWHYSACDEVTVFVLTAGAIRKNIFFEVGGFERQFGVAADIEDFEIGHRIVGKGYKMVVDKNAKFYHFEHSSRFWMLVKKLFKRTRLWMHLFSKSRKFEKNYATPSRSLAAVFAGLSLLSLLASPFVNVAGGFFLFFFLIFIVLDAGFYAYLFKDGGLFFMLFAVAVHYFFTLVICTGAGVGLLQSILGIEAQK